MLVPLAPVWLFVQCRELECSSGQRPHSTMMWPILLVRLLWCYYSQSLLAVLSSAPDRAPVWWFCDISSLVRRGWPSKQDIRFGVLLITELFTVAWVVWPLSSVRLFSGFGFFAISLGSSGSFLIVRLASAIRNTSLISSSGAPYLELEIIDLC